MYGDQFDSEKTKLRGKVDDCDFKLFVITIRYVHGVMIVAVVLNERFFFLLSLLVQVITLNLEAYFLKKTTIPQTPT